MSHNDICKGSNATLKFKRKDKNRFMSLLIGRQKTEHSFTKVGFAARERKLPELIYFFR